MQKKVYQKAIAISNEEMEKIVELQKEWSEMSGLVVKKTDVARVLILIAKITPAVKIQAILKHSKEWYK